MKKQKEKKQNRGITLIALVVTVVVLLILAAISIGVLTGENGIINRAKEAKEDSEIAEERETVEISAAQAAGKDVYGNITEDNLAEELTKNIGERDVDYKLSREGDKFVVTYIASNRSYLVDADGKITESGMTATLTIEGEKVEIPPMPSSDFTHTEGTVDTGYVIKDSKGNEFVWVPVDKNQKLKIKVSSKEKIDSISLTDPYGDELDLPNTDNLGTNYNEEREPTINGPYRLTVTSGGETKNVELNVTSLYALRMWELDMLTEEIAQKMGYKNLEQFVQDRFHLPVEEVKNHIIQIYKFGMFTDTEDYVEAVNKVGGFYIARYEASYENENVASKVSTVANMSYPPENGMLLEGIPQIVALSLSNNMYTSTEFTSSLLTGAAWDRTLSWLEETGEVSTFEIIRNSKTWGHYSDDMFSNTQELINTGEYDETEKNNIYDLAGNLWEWTTEAVGTENRVGRGR